MHLSLPEQFPLLCLFWFAVCKSLQCLISTLTQGGAGGHLFRPTLLWEGRTLQTNIIGMCGECSQCMDHTGFAPAHSSMCFPGLHCSGSRVLCRALSKAGPMFHALPRSKSLRSRFSGSPQGHRLDWACVLCPSQIQAAQVTKCLVSTMCLNHLPGPSHSVSQVHDKSSLRCAMCLPWGADLWLRPSWQMSTVQDPRKTWLATGSLLAVW